jgi:hypothetical protein
MYKEKQENLADAQTKFNDLLPMYSKSSIIINDVI